MMRSTNLPPQHVTSFTGHQLYWRSAGNGVPVVLLHGISSGSASWIKQFQDQEILDQCLLFAWDAPGYNGSTPLIQAQPTATDYADQLAQLIQRELGKPVIIVGHSLGALIGSAFASRYPQLTLGLILADPAQGYASHPDEKQRAVYQQRFSAIHELGAKKYAQQRASALLRPGADEADINIIRAGMENLQADGFLAAASMLAHDDIHHYLSNYKQPLMVLCGEQDTITPPQDAHALAEKYGQSMYLLPNAGHASYLDAPTLFNQKLLDFITQYDLKANN